MQEQAELRKSEPQEKDCQAERCTVDPYWQGFYQIRNLCAPIYQLLFVCFDRCEKSFQAVSGFGQVTAQEIGCITDKCGGLFGNRLCIRNIRVQ